MNRRFCLIVNPRSGPGPATRAVGPVEECLRDAGAEVDVVVSEEIGRTRAVVEHAVADDRVVVAVGGDGMISSVAGAVSELDGILGIVPAGSGNDFARMLGLPTDPASASGVLLRGTPRRVDLIAYALPGGGRHIAAGSVYAGIDARNSLVANELDWAPRERKYEFAAISNLIRYEPDEFELTVDGVITRHRGASVVVANSAYFGGGMPIAPDADPADGRLDIVVTHAAGRREWMETLLALPSGGHVGRDDVLVLRGRSIALRGRASDGGQVPVGADGEPLPPLPGADAQPATVDILPAALQVIVGKEPS